MSCLFILPAIPAKWRNSSDKFSFTAFFCLFHIFAEDFFHGSGKRNAKLLQGSVQSMENFTYIVESCIISHVTDADNLSGKDIEGACQHDVIVFSDSVQVAAAVVPFGTSKTVTVLE